MMIEKLTFAELAQRKATLSFDETHQCLDVMLSPIHTAFDRMVVVLRGLRFSPGVGPHWRRAIGVDSGEPVVRTIAEQLGTNVAWDCGKIYHHTYDPATALHDLVPPYWSGQRVLGVRDSGRCLVFDPGTSNVELWNQYETVYRDYQIHDFHPSE